MKREDGQATVNVPDGKIIRLLVERPPRKMGSPAIPSRPTVCVYIVSPVDTSVSNEIRALVGK